MHLIPIKTPVLHPGDDLAAILLKHVTMQPGDIVAVSSKAIATVEGRRIDYKHIQPTPEAHQWTTRCGGSPEFRQAVLDETRRLNGIILTGCPQAMLTELKPDGLQEGTILVANAGLDESNVESGYCIGWSEDAVKSVRRLRTELEELLMTNKTKKTKRNSSSSFSFSSSSVGLLITDSTCRPRRIGVTALALVVSGFDPLRSLVGNKDLFGRDLRMTQEAVADQLATAANILMGNAGESVPAVIIRDHGIPFTDFEGWVPGIEPQDDLFSFSAA